MEESLSLNTDSGSFPPFTVPPDSETFFLTLHSNPSPNSDKETNDSDAGVSATSGLTAGDSQEDSGGETSEEMLPSPNGERMILEPDKNVNLVVVASEEETASFELEVRITPTNDPDRDVPVETSNGHRVIRNSPATPKVGLKITIKNGSSSRNMNPGDATTSTANQTSVSFIVHEADQSVTVIRNLEIRESPEEKEKPDAVDGGTLEFHMPSWELGKLRSTVSVALRVPSTRARRTTVLSGRSKSTEKNEQNRGSSISLSKQEIADDMFAWKGKKKLCSRPKKRTRTMQDIRHV